TRHTITMWMPLVDVPLEAGVLTFATGSHAQGSLASMPISDESQRTFDKLVAERRFPIARRALATGDATFHSGWTLHCAPGNASDHMREVMTVIYFEDGARVAEPHNPHQPADLARWLPGLKPGDPAASPLNPVVWRE
ncbi:MAG: phytanoyl-CoA dioxygenase family protein, partial [Planctomycetes bacterium]|nr:phytanoyl-CoA dioxygenase family protein [Planctomycetota bacterium]